MNRYFKLDGDLRNKSPLPRSGGPAPRGVVTAARAAVCRCAT